jgi:hypothetical protein
LILLKPGAAAVFENAAMPFLSRCLRIGAAVLLAGSAVAVQAAPSVDAIAAEYRREVDRRLVLPDDEVLRYAHLAERAFARAEVVPMGDQYLVVVDRDPHVQAVLLMWRSAEGDYRLAGASPASTGRPGSFDHFETPLGVFAHTTENLDFRAEGTFNDNGIRGYGVKGMRVFDFGWQQVPKGWGDGRVIQMRLQMHATDPDVLEPRLGTAQSKGCIRIPATLDRLLDRRGVLDADYDALLAEGGKLWMLPEERDPVPDAGRYLVVVDSERPARPRWSPLPRRRR